MAGAGEEMIDQTADTLAESGDDWDEDVASETGDGMFDMFTAQVNARSGIDDANLNLDAYHQELEREFGEGAGNHEVLAGDVRTQWEEDEDEQDGKFPPGSDPQEHDQDGGLQHALFASNAKAYKANRKANNEAKKAKANAGRAAATTHSNLPVRTRGRGPMEESSATTIISSLPTNETTHVLTEPVDDETELVTMHGANLDIVQDQRFPYLHTDEALKGISAHMNGGVDDFDTASYRYMPLLSRTAIRTIDILPAKTLHDPIECSMHTIDLKGLAARTRDYYQTVSYAWGETDEQGSHLTHTVWLDGQKLQITGNLHAALQKIRGHLDAGRLTIFGRRATLWADAICINQLDLQERSNQVRLMEQIYANSIRVLVWLGDESFGTDKQLASAIDEGVWQLQPYGEVALSGELDMALRWVTQRPWFNRRWVVPEFALQHVRSVLFGNYAVDSRPLAYLMRTAGLSRFTGPMQYANLWDGIRTKRWLLANLQRFREAKCSVDHDILYAIRAISCGCGHAKSTCDQTDCLSWLTVDYSLSVDKLFVKVACQAAETDVIAVLSCAAIRPRDTASSLPSWVPDWRQPLSGATHIRTSTFIDDCFVEYNESHASASFYYNNIHIWARQKENPQTEVHIDQSGYLPVLELNVWLFEYVGPSEDRPLFLQEFPSTGQQYKSPKLYTLLDDEARSRKEQEVPAILNTSAGPEKFAVEFDQAFPSGVEGEALILVPWSRMAFALHKTEDAAGEHEHFALRSCFRRPIVLGNGTFEWLRGPGKRPWVIGDMSKPMHRIRIV